MFLYEVAGAAGAKYPYGGASSTVAGAALSGAAAGVANLGAFGAAAVAGCT